MSSEALRVTAEEHEKLLDAPVVVPHKHKRNQLSLIR